jgi:hypothetical protein
MSFKFYLSFWRAWILVDKYLRAAPDSSAWSAVNGIRDSVNLSSGWRKLSDAKGWCPVRFVLLMCMLILARVTAKTAGEMALLVKTR